MKPAIVLFVLTSAFLLAGNSSLEATEGPPVEYERTFGGSEYDYGYDVEQTSDGGFIVTGWTMSYGAGFSDVYLVKTNGSGGATWQRTFGGTDNDFGNAVRQTSDGGYVIVGYRHEPAVVETDVYLVKTDDSGTLQWQRTFGGSGYDRGHSVQQTCDGGYIIVGETGSYGVGGDIYLIKTNSLGEMLWQKTFGGSSGEVGNSVQESADGGFIFTGWTGSYGAGSYDVYLVKTDNSGTMLWSKTFGGVAEDRGYSVQETSDGGYVLTGLDEIVRGR